LNNEEGIGSNSNLVNLP